MQKFIIPAGGVLIGAGLTTMLFGWETAGGTDMAAQISKVGFSGVAEIGMTSNGPIAFALIAIGVALAVYGNATAWKETGGY